MKITNVAVFVLTILFMSFTQASAQSISTQLSEKTENYFNNDLPNLIYNESRKHIGEKAGGDLYLRLKLFKDGKASVQSSESNNQIHFTSIIPLRTENGRFTYEKEIDLFVGTDTFKDHKYFDSKWDVYITTLVSFDANDQAISRSVARINWREKPCLKLDFGIARFTHCFEEEASKEMLKQLQPHLDKLDRDIENFLN